MSKYNFHCLLYDKKYIKEYIKNVTKIEERNNVYGEYYTQHTKYYYILAKNSQKAQKKTFS